MVTRCWKDSNTPGGKVVWGTICSDTLSAVAPAIRALHASSQPHKNTSVGQKKALPIAPAKLKDIPIESNCCSTALIPLGNIFELLLPAGFSPCAPTSFLPAYAEGPHIEKANSGCSSSSSVRPSLVLFGDLRVCPNHSFRPFRAPVPHRALLVRSDRGGGRGEGTAKRCGVMAVPLRGRGPIYHWPENGCGWHLEGHGRGRNL